MKIADLIFVSCVARSQLTSLCINKPCKLLFQYNAILTQYLLFSSMGADGFWVYEDSDIEAKDGDVAYYWILVFINGGGYQVRLNLFYYRIIL